ncbi:Lrp/AsnC family transcriptional regulator [Dyella sedimenti]|uniref:Lrp/AsnC family transcriptional regulator n=1 Tax=Dyella sedimenti TaxID=2919947 RepID=UPI003CE45DAA
MTARRPPTLDRFDHAILKLYQANTRIVAEAGATVGLSPAAVRRRLKRMREQGVIKDEVTGCGAFWGKWPALPSTCRRRIPWGDRSRHPFPHGLPWQCLRGLRACSRSPRSPR